MGKTFIWFDLGYTLVYLEREEVYRQFLLEQGADRPLEEIERAYHAADKLFMRQYPGMLGKDPALFMPWFLGVVNYSLNLTFDLTAQFARIRDMERTQSRRWSAFPFTAAVLDHLKRHSIGIGLISNWDTTARRILEETGLIGYFDHLVISSEVGMAKPAKAIFVHALALSGVPASESLYVGDNYYDDVVGSAQAGLDAVLVNRFERLGIEELSHEPTVATIESLPALIALHSH